MVLAGLSQGKCKLELEKGEDVHAGVSHIAHTRSVVMSELQQQDTDKQAR